HSSQPSSRISDLCSTFSGQEDYALACAFLNTQERLSKEASLQKQAATEVLALCGQQLNSDMRAPYSYSDYRRMSEAGVDIYGNFYCGTRAPIVIQNEDSFGKNLLNSLT